MVGRGAGAVGREAEGLVAGMPKGVVDVVRAGGRRRRRRLSGEMVVLLSKTGTRSNKTTGMGSPRQWHGQG